MTNNKGIRNENRLMVESYLKQLNENDPYSADFSAEEDVTDTETIRQKLIEIITDLDDEKIQMIYDIITDDVLDEPESDDSPFGSENVTSFDDDSIVPNPRGDSYE